MVHLWKLVCVMRNKILFFFLSWCVVVNAQSLSYLFQGKCGKELKLAIAENCKPQKYVSSLTGVGGAWESFRLTDNLDGCVLDRYSNEKRSFSADGVSPSTGMTVDCIVNVSWWGENHDYGDAIAFDLYNLIPCDDDVTIHKKDYPPGNVLVATYDNGEWQAGYGEIAETEVNMYEPADEYKGDFARSIMYMMTIYPASRWSGLGVNFCLNNDYPTLNKYAQRILLTWHRADPISDIERTRNNEIEKIQGNRNPFVDFPRLAEHVWGVESGNPFDVEVKRIPLKSTYRLSDERIDLYHQSIPEDAVWSINGLDVSQNFVSPAELGIGIHELKFSSQSVKGKLKIKIVE